MALVLGVAWWLGLLTPEPAEVSLDSAIAAQTTAPVDESADTTAAGSATTLGADDDVTIAGRWTLVANDATFAGYRADSRVGEAVGRTQVMVGRLVATETEVTEVSVTVDLSELESDSALRDQHLGDEGLEHNRYPTSRFKLTRPIALPAGAGAEGTPPLEFTAVGDLTVRDIANQVEVMLEATIVEGRLVVVGSTLIELADFGATIDDIDQATMEFSLVFERA